VSAELLVAIDTRPESADDLRSLRNWLTDVDELRGLVRLRATEAPPGTLGWFSDTVVVTTPVVAALVPALISWIRSRHTDVDVKVSWPGGPSVEVSAQRVRRLAADDLGIEIERLVRALDAGRAYAEPNSAMESPGDRAG
jgi:hypothetical protein